MAALDGNAIAGALFEVFGEEMTAAVGICAHCGAEGALAELRVYQRGPGVVGRCRSCEAVVMVLVEIRGVTCVDLSGLAGIEHAAGSG